MLYTPNIENINVWATEGLTCQLTAVPMPGDRIETLTNYLELLADRVEWMIWQRIEEVTAEIQEASEEELEELEELDRNPKARVLQEIRAITSPLYRMGNLSLTRDPMQWAMTMVEDYTDFHEALVESLPMREYPPRELFQFPLTPPEPSEMERIRGVIQETTLEEWLIMMRGAIIYQSRD